MSKCNESNCCKLPVCLEFTGATATDEFKEQVAEIFAEIFSNACGQVCNNNNNGNSNKENK